MRFIAAAVSALLVGMVQIPWSATAAADMGLITSYSVEAEYEDVRADLADAVINRGFVIDYEAHIGAMLNRTAADVGAKTTVYKNAEAIQFCSATLSRDTMEADAMNIAFCPYVLFVYELADKPGTVTVGFRRLADTGSAASRKALGAVNALLDEIVKEAADM